MHKSTYMFNNYFFYFAINFFFSYLIYISHVDPYILKNHKISKLKTKGRAIKGLVVCWSMTRINDLWDGSMDKRKVRSLVPCCGQDGNRAQVPQHSIDLYNI